MIDLDDLAKKATAVRDEHPWRVYRCDRADPDEACGIKASPLVSRDDDACQIGVVHDTSHDECHHQMALVDAEHIAANSPDVTLKLIARIRELENALKACAWKLHGEDIDPDGKESDVFLAIARKGIP